MEVKERKEYTPSLTLVNLLWGQIPLQQKTEKQETNKQVHEWTGAHHMELKSFTAVAQDLPSIYFNKEQYILDK